jgi:membrane associated rhomboid family serine protease
VADDFFSNGGVRNALAGMMGAFVQFIMHKDASTKEAVLSIAAATITAYYAAPWLSRLLAGDQSLAGFAVGFVGVYPVYRVIVRSLLNGNGKHG